MLGTGYLFIRDYAVLFEGEGSLRVGKNISLGSVSFNGKGYLLTNPEIAYVNVDLPALGGAAYEVNNSGYGYCGAMLPGLITEASGGFYVPAEPQVAFSILPALTTYATGISVGIGEHDSEFSPLQGKAWESTDGGELSATLPALKSIGSVDFSPGEVQFFNRMSLINTYSPVQEHIFLFNSAGVFVDSYSASREMIAWMINSMTISVEYTVIGSFIAQFSNPMVANFEVFAAIDGTPALDDTARVWVVEMGSGASWQYDNYGFNSFLEKDGEYFGIADDGIYKLEGADDAGVDIDSCIEIGKSMYGSYFSKKSRGIYIGCSSDGDIFIKIDTDGVENIYQIQETSTTLATHKVPVSQRKLGTYWNLTLVNSEGSDFDVSDITFILYTISRRIK